MDYKVDEIEDYAREYIKDALTYNKDYLDEKDIQEVHHDIFNTDYYIIGRYDARKWCKDEAFNIIGFIKDYEMDNFGEVYTDLSEPERVVNMYVYIIGEEILEEVINEITDLQVVKLNKEIKQDETITYETRKDMFMDNPIKQNKTGDK